MPSQQIIPSVLLFESKLRLCEDMLLVYNIELQRLELKLKYGEIEQSAYDDCIVAIEHDKRHLKEEITTLTEIKSSVERGAA